MSPPQCISTSSTVSVLKQFYLHNLFSMYTKAILLLLQISLVICKPSPAEVDAIFFGEASFPCTATLCDHGPNYNDRDVINVVKNNTKYHYLFGNVVDKDMKIEDRFGDDTGTSNMCPTRTVMMFPKQGRNIYNELKTIVNVGNYKQMVSYEECVPDTECYVKKEYLPLGVKSYCENNYIIIRLVVINDNKMLGLEKFSIPSGCSCTYSKDYYYR